MKKTSMYIKPRPNFPHCSPPSQPEHLTNPSRPVPWRHILLRSLPVTRGTVTKGKNSLRQKHGLLLVIICYYWLLMVTNGY